MAPAGPAMRVLDVGCGTGSHLARYAARGASVTGVDVEPAMLARARRRLGPEAVLVAAAGESLPFGDAAFDLVLTMTVLHALPAESAQRVLAEMARTVRPEGRVLVVDHHPGRLIGIRGRVIRAFTGAVEHAGGREHFRRFRAFLAAGGVPALAGAAGLEIESWALEAASTMGVYVLRPGG
jgi:ubiquinone/menaquinone biosynthesis C-methylase UbiE